MTHFHSQWRSLAVALAAGALVMLTACDRMGNKPSTNSTTPPNTVNSVPPGGTGQTPASGGTTGTTSGSQGGTGAPAGSSGGTQ